jgi:dihydroorotase-like cyclic amidohydrolase
VGAAANLVLFDTRTPRRVDEASFRSRSVNSWLLGATLKGTVRLTLAAGRLAHAA